MAGNLSEAGMVVLKEEVVLEKFEGTPETGELIERVYITDGVITRHQYFKNGKMIREEEKEGIN